MQLDIGRIVLKSKNQNNHMINGGYKGVKTIKVSTNYSCKELCELISKNISENDLVVDYLVTPGGFLKFNFPTKYENYTLKRIDLDYEEVLDLLIEEAKKKAKNFVDCIKKNNINFFINDKKIIIGMDAINNNGVHIELALVVNSKGDTLHWTGKSYPTKKQENKLIRIKDYSTHIYRSKNQNILIMICHDLNMYNKRTVNKSSFRQDIVNDFNTETICNNQIYAILHLPHTIDHFGTWTSAWNQLKK